MRLNALIDRVPFATEISGDRRPFLPEYAFALADLLGSSSPKGVTAVFGVLPRRQDALVLLPQLVTVGKYRSAYSVIERMARTLAPTVMQMDATPIIVPVAERVLAGMSADTPLIRRLIHRGFRLTQR